MFSVAYSPDGTRLITGSADKTAGAWDVKTGQSLASFVGHTAEVRAASYSPMGRGW